MGQFQRPFGRKQRSPQGIPTQAPVPLDPRIPSIAQLPDEAVLLILNFVDNVTLCKIASLSSSLYDSSRRVQHRTMVVDLTEGRRTRSRLDLLAQNLLLPAVQVLTVNIDRMKNENGRFEFVATYIPRDDILDVVADSVSGMTGLLDLHWQCLVPVPWTLLQRIPSHTRLHTTIFAPEHDHEDQEQVWTCLTRLHGNRNLFSLSIHIVFQDEHRCRVRIQALKRVLLSCPRLARIPNLYVGPVHNMICGLGDGPLLGAVYCGLGFCRGEIPPALEELGVRSYFCYPWGQEQTFAFGPDSIYSIGYPERGSEVQYCAQNFDWTRPDCAN